VAAAASRPNTCVTGTASSNSADAWLDEETKTASALGLFTARLMYIMLGVTFNLRSTLRVRPTANYEDSQI
jgi:hypothetical protein